MQTTAQRAPAKVNGEQVVVGCKLPFGIIIHAGSKWTEDRQTLLDPGEKRTLNGKDHPSAKFGFGITSVDKAFWDAWILEQGGRNEAVRNGFIFAAPKHDDVIGEARSRALMKNGFEPLDFADPNGDKRIIPETEMMKAAGIVPKPEEDVRIN